MSARFLNIVKRNRDLLSAAVVSADDFELAEAGDATLDQVISNPHVTLYALDHQRQRALFVETPPDADIASYPFLYQAQVKFATRFVAVPYPLFYEWASRCERPTELVVIHSVGRCGSTLLSKFLDEVDSIQSLSEPDVFTQINDLVLWKKLSAEEASPLLRASVLVCWKPALKRSASWLAIKMRSQVIGTASLLEREFPSARVLFMYRNAADVVTSTYRLRRGRTEAIAMLKSRLEAVTTGGAARALGQIFAEHGHLGLEVAYWAWIVDEYLKMGPRGLDPLAVRYEDLMSSPDGVMTRLFARWGLDWDPSISARVMKEDSQRGTALARPDQEYSLADEEREIVARLLPSIFGVGAADTILPGTV